MNKSSWYSLALSVGVSIATVSCTPAAQPPTATSSPAAPATSSPSAAASPPKTTAAASTPNAKPSEPASSAAKPSGATAPTTAANKPKDNAPDVVQIAVINNSGKTLKAIFMAPPSKDVWGENELTAPIPDREKAEYEWKRSDYKGAEAGCIFEIRAEYDDGKSAELDPIDLCKTPVINLK